MRHYVDRVLPHAGRGPAAKPLTRSQAIDVVIATCSGAPRVTIELETQTIRDLPITAVGTGVDQGLKGWQFPLAVTVGECLEALITDFRAHPDGVFRMRVDFVNGGQSVELDVEHECGMRVGRRFGSEMTGQQKYHGFVRVNSIRGTALWLQLSMLLAGKELVTA
jgi:hypothetical protein